MGTSAPTAAGPELTDEELANGLEVELAYLQPAIEYLIEDDQFEIAGYLHLLKLDLPEAIRRLREG